MSCSTKGSLTWNRGGGNGKVVLDAHAPTSVNTGFYVGLPYPIPTPAILLQLLKF